MTQKLATGVAHALPADIRRALVTSGTLVARWNALTPLARNEWICWTISVKKAATRADHVRRLTEEIPAGKKRPCCWPGCTHRQKGTSHRVV